MISEQCDDCIVIKGIICSRPSIAGDLRCAGSPDGNYLLEVCAIRNTPALARVRQIISDLDKRKVSNREGSETLFVHGASLLSRGTHGTQHSPQTPSSTN